MNDWVRHRLQSWGHQRYKRLTEEEKGAQSNMGKIMEMGSSRSDTPACFQRFREGLTGDGLQCWLAILRAMMAHKLSDKMYMSLFVHYCFPTKDQEDGKPWFPVDEKVAACGFRNRTPYYRRLHRAEAVLEEYFL